MSRIREDGRCRRFGKPPGMAMARSALPRSSGGGLRGSSKVRFPQHGEHRLGGQFWGVASQAGECGRSPSTHHAQGHGALQGFDPAPGLKPAGTSLRCASVDDTTPASAGWSAAATIRSQAVLMCNRQTRPPQACGPQRLYRSCKACRNCTFDKEPESRNYLVSSTFMKKVVFCKCRQGRAISKPCNVRDAWSVTYMGKSHSTSEVR